MLQNHVTPHTFCVERTQPHFGIRVRKLRLDRGMSQFDLAEEVELSEDQINNIERGKSWVGEVTFALLAKALHVSQNSLTDYSGNEAFIKSGGLKRRAPRKRAKLIVRSKRKLLVPIPKPKR